MERPRADRASEPSAAASPPSAPDAPMFEHLGPVADTLYWWQRHKEGDQDAVNRLFARYHERLARIVRLRMSEWLRRHTDPEEIVNSTFLTAWKNLHKFEMRDHASLMLWLDKIAQRKITDAADYWRQQKRDARRNERIDFNGPNEDGGARQFADTGPSPSTIHARAELKQLYDECVASLPDDIREIVLMREYAGCTGEEVARRLGKPSTHAVEEAYRRARVRLAACLKKKLGPQ